MPLSRNTSITLRLTLLFAAASSFVLLLLGLLIASLTEQHFEELDVDLLQGKLRQTQHVLALCRTPAELARAATQIETSMIGQAGLAVVVVGPDRQLLYASRETEFPAELLRPQPPAPPHTWTSAEGLHLRGIAAPAPTGIAGAAPAIVAVATDIAHHTHFMRSFQITLWSVVVLAAALTGVLGWVAARRGLAPLQSIRQAAAGITAHRLETRLSAEAVPAELRELIDTLNAMLARLEESFRRLSDFSSDIAHELRTPVGNLLTQTQVTLSKARSADEYRDILASNAEEFERLSRMIADMLFLAKADNELLIPHRETVDLAREVAELIEFYGLLAEEKGISMSSAGKGQVAGDRLMLRRAISNLLSNAVRHTPAGGRVLVRIDEAEDSALHVTVENSGETIAAEHLPRLFDRFYRVDTSRQRFSEGAGLGLAITRSILRAHGGDATLRSADGITAVELVIPA